MASPEQLPKKGGESGENQSVPVTAGSVEVAKSGQAGFGYGEDVSEERILALQGEVNELAAKVADYRVKGPVAFGLLVEKSLSNFRFSLAPTDTQEKESSSSSETNLDEIQDELRVQQTTLGERLAAATASLPAILGELKACTNRLDNAMAALKQPPFEVSTLEIKSP